MSTSDKVKALLRMCGKRQNELAVRFGISSQSMNNKMSRDSWSARDLMTAAEFAGCKLAFIFPDGSRITLDKAEEVPDE